MERPFGSRLGRSVSPFGWGGVVAGGVALLLSAPLGAGQETDAGDEVVGGLRLLGHQSFDDHSVRFADTVVGGLSGLEFDPETGRYLAISDDPATASRGSARFYTLELDFDTRAFRRYEFTSVTTLLQPDGAPFPEGGVDPEAIRRLPSGNYLWTSEGFERSLTDPFVRETTPAGAYVRDLETPRRFAPTPGPPTDREPTAEERLARKLAADTKRGSRQNLVFESLTLTPDGRWAVTATEGALYQDGPIASSTTGSLSRVLYLDLSTGAAGAEYVYPIDSVYRAGDRPGEGLDGEFRVNGLVELLALDEQTFLALERSYRTDQGHAVRLHCFDVSRASDVSRLESLFAADFVAGEKTLLADLGRFGVELSNLEGLTFGPVLETGNPSLVIVSDDNFDGVTQFFAFEVFPAAVPGACGRALRSAR